MNFTTIICCSAGYGGEVPRLQQDNPDRDYGDTNIHVKGNVDIDAIGVGLQANQRSYYC